jgi:hypothetical protein
MATIHILIGIKMNVEELEPGSVEFDRAQRFAKLREQPKNNNKFIKIQEQLLEFYKTNRQHNKPKQLIGIREKRQKSPQKNKSYYESRKHFNIILHSFSLKKSYFLLFFS